MAIPWATILVHFHQNKLFKTCFALWYYFALNLFWLIFKTLGEFFPNHLVNLAISDKHTSTALITVVKRFSV
jgi:hypothetical protein